MENARVELALDNLSVSINLLLYLVYFRFRLSQRLRRSLLVVDNLLTDQDRQSD
jgi:hypothetical protein